MEQHSSIYKLISTGIVAADKNDGSPFISVFLKELHPFHEGDISPAHATTNYSGIDKDGNNYSIDLQMGMTVKCKWKKAGNRITSPNVRKGEEVFVYEIGNEGVYYWEENPESNHLRRGEMIVHAWNADSKPTTTDVPPTADNHYTATVDGKNGHITITTSKANKEVASYVVQINGKKGHITINDNKGNIIQLNSAKDILSINTNAAVNVKTKATTIITDTLDIKANKTYVDCPDTTFTGNVKIGKNLTVNGNENLSGTLTAGNIAGNPDHDN